MVEKSPGKYVNTNMNPKKQQVEKKQITCRVLQEKISSKTEITSNDSYFSALNNSLRRILVQRKIF